MISRRAASGLCQFGPLCLFWNQRLRVFDSLCQGSSVRPLPGHWGVGDVDFCYTDQLPVFEVERRLFRPGKFRAVSEKLFELVAGSLRDFTGGTQGISLKFLAVSVLLRHITFFLGVALLTVLVCYWIPRSKFGLALFGVREDEEVAAAFGIDVTKYKMRAYVLSALFPALLGGVYAWYSAFYRPGSRVRHGQGAAPRDHGDAGGNRNLSWGPIMGGDLHDADRGAAVDFDVAPRPGSKSLHLTMLGLDRSQAIGIFSPGGLVIALRPSQSVSRGSDWADSWVPPTSL